MSAPLLSLPPELFEKIIKNLNYRSIIAVRLTCKQFQQATESRHLWKHLIDQLKTEAGVLGLEAPLDQYSLLELEKWVARRHTVNELWTSSSPTIFSREFLGVREYGRGSSCVQLLLGGRLCLYTRQSVANNIWMVDLDSTNPEPVILCNAPSLATIAGRKNMQPVTLSHWVDNSQDYLSVYVVIAYTTGELTGTPTYHWSLYQIKATGNPTNISFATELLWERVTPRHGFLCQMLLTDSYWLRIMHNDQPGSQLYLHPRINGVYSQDPIQATIRTKQAYPLTDLPGNRFLVAADFGHNIYDLSQLLSPPHSTTSSSSGPVLLKPSPVQRDQIHYNDPSIEPHSSFPQIGPNSTRIVIMDPECLFGLEIPHDPTKPTRSVDFYTWDMESESAPYWVGIGVSKSLCVIDDKLTTISHEWSFGNDDDDIGGDRPVVVDVKTHVDVDVSQFEEWWNSTGRYGEDIGRVAFTSFRDSNPHIVDLLYHHLKKVDSNTGSLVEQVSAININSKYGSIQ